MKTIVIVPLLIILVGALIFGGCKAATPAPARPSAKALSIPPAPHHYCYLICQIK